MTFNKLVLITAQKKKKKDLFNCIGEKGARGRALNKFRPKSYPKKTISLGLLSVQIPYGFFPCGFDYQQV